MTDAMTSTEQVIERAYREGYRNGFVDATITEDGYPDESIVLKRVSEVSLAEGWDACRDKFLDTSEEMETCDQCGGAGGDNQHWVCDKCGGTGGYPANTPVDSEVERLLKKAREFAVLFLAFDGRDRHTDRQDRTYDDLSRMAVDLDAQLRAALASLPPKPVDGAPIDMVLFCPKCGQQHIDKPDPDDAWDNPPHKSHKCVGPNGCGTIWRPADVPTNGVIATQSRGSKDTIFYNFAAIPPVDSEVAEPMVTDALERIGAALRTCEHCRDHRTVWVSRTTGFPLGDLRALFAMVSAGEKGTDDAK